MAMDDDFEGVNVFGGSGDSGGSELGLISNVEQWPSGSLKYHPLDAVICATGLAANIATSFSVFFSDMRRDLCAARNRVVNSGLVSEFDDQLLRLPSIDD